MFAIIGFVLVCAIGLYCFFGGIIAWIGVGMFSSPSKTWGFLIFTVIGALILYWAYNNSPIHFTVVS